MNFIQIVALLALACGVLMGVIAYKIRNAYPTLAAIYTAIGITSIFMAVFAFSVTLADKYYSLPGGAIYVN